MNPKELKNTNSSAERFVTQSLLYPTKSERADAFADAFAVTSAQPPSSGGLETILRVVK